MLSEKKAAVHLKLCKYTEVSSADPDMRGVHIREESRRNFSAAREEKTHKQPAERNSEAIQTNLKNVP